MAALIARGLSNREIAEALVISESTAEVHVKRILGKLHFKSRSQVATWATQRATARIGTNTSARRIPPCCRPADLTPANADPQ